MKVKWEEAKRIVEESTETVKETELVVLEEAEGRVLAEDVLSPIDVPDVDKSAVDGFAFKSSSLKNLPAELKVVGETAAGDTERKKVKEGEAVFVMTGGELPEGADAVVRVEDVKVEGDRVTVDFPVEAGTLVNFRGSELKRGSVLVGRGEFLNPLKVSLLAYVGVFAFKVFRKPRVGILTTGTEILEPWERFKKGGAYNSNYYLLKSLIERAGGEAVRLGKVKDNPEVLLRAIDEAFNHVDILVTTGGVSKGKYDFVKEVIHKAGVEVFFKQTNVRPGRPLVFGKKGRKLFFGLPGYPTAAAVNALEFLIPAVRKMAGARKWRNTYLKAEATERLKSRVGRVDFVRVNLFEEGGKLKVKSAGSQQTSVFHSFANSNGLALVPEGRGPVERGEYVDVLPLFQFL